MCVSYAVRTTVRATSQQQRKHHQQRHVRRGHVFVGDKRAWICACLHVCMHSRAVGVSGHLAADNRAVHLSEHAQVRHLVHATFTAVAYIRCKHFCKLARHSNRTRKAQGAVRTALQQYYGQGCGSLDMCASEVFSLNTLDPFNRSHLHV
jgi:hypothetical protein